MSLTTTAKNAALDTLGVVACSIHTENPTESGAVGELAGGGYTRQSLSFNAAGGGQAVMTQSDVTFTIPAGAVISHYALWNGGGVCVATGALPTVEQYVDPGTYRVTDFVLALNGCP